MAPTSMMQDRMRVLLTVPHLVPTASPYRETMALVKYLPRDEFEVGLCVLRPAGLEAAAPELARCGVKSFVARFRPTAPTVRGVAAAISDQRVIRAWGRVDLQHSLDFTSSPFEVMLARAHGRRFVYTQRNLNEDGHPRLLKLKVGLSAGVAAISNVSRALVESLAGPRLVMSTIPLGFDFDGREQLPAWEPPRARCVVLSVGHLQRRKRLEDAIHAIALARTAVPNIELWIVGRPHDKPYQRELAALSESLGVADRVTFLGVREDVVEIMRQASVLLHCAESEAFGWSLLESMAVGLPVVSCDGGGPAELLEHGVTGFLVKVRDYRGASHYLAEVLNNPALAARLSAAAQAKARTDYNAETFARKYAAFYRQFVDVAGAQKVTGAA